MFFAVTFPESGKWLLKIFYGFALSLPYQELPAGMANCKIPFWEMQK
jgi:hypothetical protein